VLVALRVRVASAEAIDAGGEANDHGGSTDAGQFGLVVLGELDGILGGVDDAVGGDGGVNGGVHTGNSDTIAHGKLSVRGLIITHVFHANYFFAA